MTSPTSQTYLNARTNLLNAVEGGASTTIYLDTRGIPTIGNGVALIATPNKYNGYQYTVDTQKTALLANDLGQASLDPSLVSTLQGIAQSLNDNVQPAYSGKKLASAFWSSSLGQAIQQNITDNNPNATINTKSWNILPQIRLSGQPASWGLTQAAINTAETKLDNLISNSGITNADITDSQRAALFSIVYHGNSIQANNVIDAIRNGATDQQLAQVAYDKKFPVRSAIEIKALTSGIATDSVYSSAPTNSIMDSTGNVIGYTDTLVDSRGQTANIITRKADGSIASQVFSDGATVTTIQGGITTTRDVATGVTTASIDGLGSSFQVGSDGAIAAGGYLIKLPSDPLGGINVQTAGGTSITIPAGANITSNGENLMMSQRYRSRFLFNELR